MTQPLRRIMASVVVGIFAAGCQSSGSTATASSEPAPTVNPDFRVNPDLVSAGSQAYINRGCFICHQMGRGRAAGPDLFGVTERRTIDWLTRFLKNTGEMLDSDPIAHALLEEYKFQRMPTIAMTDREIEALIHYIQAETTRKRTGAE
jgi:cbb3-type cytochrome oxidase cytochrome c subunit